MSESTKTQSFALGEHDRDFITDMVENGRFGNKTEVVRAGLRLLEDYENTQKLHRLRALIAEGEADIAAGRYTAYDNRDTLFNEIMDD
ncbi:MAG: type II toxin-antitoxin system ParD family antitoxin [Pseudomonadota bacterium]